MKTDAQLLQDVATELNWWPSLSTTQIGVKVKDGIVTLAGHVGSFAEKWDAEHVAQNIEGVKGLAIEMDVMLSRSGKRNDDYIAYAAEDASQWTGRFAIFSLD